MNRPKLKEASINLSTTPKQNSARLFVALAPRLEINDPCLPELVRRVDSVETILDNLNLPPTSEEKIEALAEMICHAGDEPSAALLVLMATLEKRSASESTCEYSKALRIHALC